MTRGLLRKKATSKQVKQLNFAIDCSQPVEDGVFETKDFETFLKQRIKVAGKKGNLGTSVSLKHDSNKIQVSAEAPFSKRYLKYLSKKYLKKHQLRDFLHVIANEKQGYQIRYFNIQAQDEGEQ
eukprot:TRINITY_DN0_c1356_g1_i1.p1 TRINITY_DN0_c1356_g1~~TRINITY_DN0_c1356_g1_i1.p1  ORF type:complete len:124 (+),score=51.30 TRINITY_DN0_c1356_g1_i1:52-423(+)